MSLSGLLHQKRPADGGGGGYGGKGGKGGGGFGGWEVELPVEFLEKQNEKRKN